MVCDAVMVMVIAIDMAMFIVNGNAIALVTNMAMIMAIAMCMAMVVALAMADVIAMCMIMAMTMSLAFTSGTLFKVAHCVIRLRCLMAQRTRCAHALWALNVHWAHCAYSNGPKRSTAPIGSFV